MVTRQSQYPGMESSVMSGYPTSRPQPDRESGSGEVRVPWKLCRCPSHDDNVAVINPVWMPGFPEPTPEDEKFLLAYQGHFVCFDCGGEVSDELEGCDHVTGSTVCMRLRELGVIRPDATRTDSVQEHIEPPDVK